MSKSLFPKNMILASLMDNTPWLITVSAQKELEKTLMSADISLDIPLTDPTETPLPEVNDGIAIINIDGILARNVSVLGKLFGLVDSEDIQTIIELAKDDTTISGVILNINSPGGQVNGTLELAQAVKELKSVKPVIAYTNSLMASAAYWIGSQATAIYGSPSAEIGSIGVITEIKDTSKMFESAGVKNQVIKSGKFKGAGVPGTSLTLEQLAQIQGQIDYMYGLFVKSVREGRGNVLDEAMQGQIFYMSQAVEQNLADYVSSMDVAISDLRKMVK
jgi:signal peptide peptidase SppA